MIDEVPMYFVFFVWYNILRLFNIKYLKINYKG